MEEAEDATEDPDPEEAELQPLETLVVNQDQTGDHVITPHHHLPAVTTTIGGGRTRGSAWSRQAAHGKTNALPDQRIEDLTSSTPENFSEVDSEDEDKVTDYLEKLSVELASECCEGHFDSETSTSQAATSNSEIRLEIASSTNPFS